jgi:hypothetical protein
LKDEVKHREGLLLDIKLNEVPLIPRISCRIPNARSQGSTEETMESVQLWKEVLDLGRSDHCTWGIHKLHLVELEHIIGMNPSLWQHGQLMLKPQYPSKLMNSNSTPLPICHPKQPLLISIKVQNGVELSDDFPIPTILEAHHLCHLELITGGFDLVKSRESPSSHLNSVHPLRLHHWLQLVEIDRPVPIRVKECPKMRVTGLLAALIHWSFMVVIDGALLHLLGVAEGHVGGPLNRRMIFKHFTIISLFIAGVRRMMRRRRGVTPCKHLAEAASLGGRGSGHILMILGSLLTVRIHP